MAKPAPILVAVDFSPDAEGALSAALGLAKDLKAAVHLVHVVEIPFLTSGVPYSEAILSPDIIRKDEEAAALDLASWARDAKKAGVAATVAVLAGHPASCILAEAKKRKVGLIVVGTHGRTGFRKFVMGSVAQGVIQKADRPVLVVPQGKGK